MVMSSSTGAGREQPEVAPVYLIGIGVARLVRCRLRDGKAVKGRRLAPQGWLRVASHPRVLPWILLLMHFGARDQVTSIYCIDSQGNRGIVPVIVRPGGPGSRRSDRVAEICD
jgi:hypothetical protein